MKISVWRTVRLNRQGECRDFLGVEFRAVLSPSFSLVLVHQFVKATPGPLNVLINYCFLETVASETGILLFSGKPPLDRSCPMPLWGIAAVP